MPTPRLYTVREAEATLPLVRGIVADLLATHRRWTELVARYELLTGPLRADEGEPLELIALRDSAARDAERINACLEEIEQLGGVFKGFDLGLVDFYALKDDRLVFLCWQPGEERITHWHEVDAGFAGRQPIDAHMLAETVIG
jgi:hypothetical protein